MNGPKKWNRALRWMLAGLSLVAVFGVTGCQVEMGGQTLPSAYYLTDDVQYFPSGPEFLLTREAAAQQEARGEQAEMR